MIEPVEEPVLIPGPVGMALVVVVIPGPVGMTRGGGDVRTGGDREALGDGSCDIGAAGDGGA